MEKNWNINGFYTKEEEERREALKMKIEAQQKGFASCYLIVDNKLQIHIYDKVLQRRYVFVADSNIKPYIDVLKAKGYYEYVALNESQLEKDDNEVVYYLQYKCPFELYEPGATWQIITLHHLVVAVNLFKAEANFDSIVQCNNKRNILTKTKRQGGKYVFVVDHISNKKPQIPLMQKGEYIPKLPEAEEQEYNKFCEILPKLAENIREKQLVCITPANTNHAQCSNEYSNLVLLKGQTNRLKSNIVDKHLGLYAGIDHEQNIFVITFYTQYGFEINNEKCCRFSVLYDLPTSADQIEQLKLQAEALQKIYMRYELAQEEAQEIFEAYNKQITIACWNDIKQVYANLIKGNTVLYIPAEEMNKDFNNLYMNKDVFFAPGDTRVKSVKFE